MYFKKLELLGFKSFAGKTSLHFEPGITAVVGPNGCGKSNIFDSIRWVLGEQSVKSLRGSKMEDVIFNGTESIAPLGYAEVSLTFANDTKALPIDYDEVTISRRLYRSGESEYLINKTQVRLKDITELFMGTGIGAESYSLIEQGKIDLILSSRPEDRRLVFDEAAGISKYKAQKKETLRKLEDTEANLLRINDIITEVRRQINSLERQAAKARRYKEVFDRLKGLEAEFTAVEIAGHKNRLIQINTELNLFDSQEKDDAAHIERLTRELGAAQSELQRLENTDISLRDQKNALENSALRLNQQIDFNRERSKEFKIRIVTQNQKKEGLSEKILRDQEKISLLDNSLNSLARELEEKESQGQNSRKELDSINQDIHSLQENLKALKSKVMEFASEEASLHNKIQKLSGLLNQAIARKKRLDIEKIKSREELNSINTSLSASQAQELAALGILTAEKDGCEKIKIELSLAVSKKEEFNLRLQALGNEKTAFESQKEFLSNLKLRYENIAESSEAIILINSLNTEKISGIIIKVENIENAGESDIAAYSQARYKARGLAKPISLDPQEIIDKIESLNQEIAKAMDELNQNTLHITSLTEQLSASESALRQRELDYNTCKNKRENTQNEADKLNQESVLIYDEAKETDSELNNLSAQENDLNASQILLKDASIENQRGIEACADEISLKNNLREETQLKITRLNVEISACRDKLSSLEDNKRIFEDSLAKGQSALAEIIQDEAASNERVRVLADEQAKLDTEITDSKNKCLSLEEELKQNAFGLQEFQAKTGALQKDILQRKESSDSRKSRVHKLQMQEQEINFIVNGIYERMEQVYKIKPDEISADISRQDNTQDIQQEIGQLKQKIESYGQVNLVAIEEFEELKQRSDFLNSQHDDLIKSKESLHEAILKINRTTKKMFMDTFEKLAAEFRNYFKLLFGGGDAQLFLLDEENVLESGIEIACRPPGKKLQNVLLLSGGEKAMSAIALLFAIFKVKPSPFCVLDEIDAALDESNVDKFSRMLVDFTSQSQFIVITHNKKTIANADIMYGITMEDAGISKIVSVKLKQQGSGLKTPNDL